MNHPMPPRPTWIPSPGPGFENLEAHLDAFKEMDRKYAEYREALEEFAKKLRERFFDDMQGNSQNEEPREFTLVWKYGKSVIPKQLSQWVIKSKALEDKKTWKILHDSIVTYKPKYFAKAK